MYTKKWSLLLLTTCLVGTIQAMKTRTWAQVAAVPQKMTTAQRKQLQAKNKKLERREGYTRLKECFESATDYRTKKAIFNDLLNQYLTDKKRYASQIADLQYELQRAKPIKKPLAWSIPIQSTGYAKPTLISDLVKDFRKKPTQKKFEKIRQHLNDDNMGDRALIMSLVNILLPAPPLPSVDRNVLAIVGTQMSPVQASDSTETNANDEDVPSWMTESTVVAIKHAEEKNRELEKVQREAREAEEAKQAKLKQKQKEAQENDAWCTQLLKNLASTDIKHEKAAIRTEIDKLKYDEKALNSFIGSLQLDEKSTKSLSVKLKESQASLLWRVLGY